MSFVVLVGIGDIHNRKQWPQLAWFHFGWDVGMYIITNVPCIIHVAGICQTFLSRWSSECFLLKKPSLYLIISRWKSIKRCCSLYSIPLWRGPNLSLRYSGEIQLLDCQDGRCSFLKLYAYILLSLSRIWWDYIWTCHRLNEWKYFSSSINMP